MWVFLQMLARSHTTGNICGAACTTQGATPSPPAHLLIKIKPSVRSDHQHFFLLPKKTKMSGDIFLGEVISMEPECNATTNSATEPLLHLLSL